VKSNVYFGGMPVEPDIRKLRARFGVPEPGQLITHEEIEVCLSVPYRRKIPGETFAPINTRYRTITKRWCDELRAEASRDHEAVPGVGIRFLTAAGVVKASKSDVRTGVRRIGKGTRRLALVSPVELHHDPAVLADYDHTRRIVTGLYLAGQHAARAMLKPPAPPDPLPRVQMS